MPDFEFQPWEHISPDVAGGEAHARAWHWVFRLCGECWFARRRSQTGNEWNYLYPPIDSLSSVYGFYVSGASTLEDWLSCFKLKTFVEEVTAGVVRVWQRGKTNDERKFCIVWHPRRGWLIAATPLHLFKSDIRLCPFALDWSAPVADTPSSLLFSRLETEWQDPNSDLRSSAHAAALDDEDYMLLGMQTRIESPQKFVHLLRSAAQALSSRWPTNTLYLQLYFSSMGKIGKYVLHGNVPFGIREKAILNHIVRTYEPCRLADSPVLPSAVRVLTEGEGRRSFSVSVARPTMHEQLEAMLVLREWLIVHWPEGVRHLSKVV